MKKKMFLLLLALELCLGGKAFSSRLTEFVGKSVSMGPVREAKYDGNDVVVRVYEDWKNEPEEYWKVSLEISNGDRVEFGRYEFPEECVVAIVGEDQDNAVIKEVLKDCLFVSKYGKNLYYWVRGDSYGEKSKWLFKDGVGDVFPSGKVKVFAHASSASGPGFFINEYELKDGLLEGPFVRGRWKIFSFIVSHPEYGRARAVAYYGRDVVHLPLVKEGSEADATSVHGIVVGPGPLPLGGIEIRCTEVRTLGEGLINPLDGGNSHGVISDDAGHFRIYPPNQDRKEERGKFIPPRSRYRLHTILPKESEFRSYEGWVSNDEEVVIHLNRKKITEYTEQFREAQGGNYHRFVFKNEDGEMFSPEEQKEMVLYIHRKDKARLRLSPSDWENGGLFPNGLYDASILQYNRMDGRHVLLKFNDITVTDEDPTDLVFELGDKIKFFGKVVDGRDDTPYAGAFVVVIGGGSQHNLSDVNSMEWEKLHLLRDEPVIDEPALKPIHKVYSFKKMLLTDMEGRFKFEMLPDDSFWGIVVFDENWLPVKLDAVNRMSRMEKPVREFDFGKVNMFPAAKVFVRTLLKERASIMPGWQLVGDNNPQWAKSIANIDRKWLKKRSEEKQSFSVPAEVNLKLKFTTPYDDKWWSKNDFEEIYLEQGQAHDCGELRLERSIWISVLVVDPNGDAVEGAPVRIARSGGWSVAHITGIDGRAKFYVPPNSEGGVSVVYHAEDGKHLNKRTDYKIAGKEDEGKEYKIELSEVELEILGL